MNDVERELKQLQEFIETWERSRPPDDTGYGDSPDSSVPAPVKPRPLGAIGAAAVPEANEDDTPVQQHKGPIARPNE